MDKTTHKSKQIEDPKVLSTRVRLSEKDIKKLKTCAEQLKITKSEVIRKGIDIVYKNLEQ